MTASASDTKSVSDSTTYTNSHLNASNITIISTKDTTVKGGVVTAENDLTLDVGGDLTVKSLQDDNNSKSVTLGVSGGVNSGGGNAGANFNLSKTESDWVNEQTSLTGGGKVTIDVEDKTTLKGAVIASTTNDLNLETGSLDYSNIKDKDKSYSVGGGMDVGTKSDKSYGNYEFSDKKQTNFATIGEGTIIVKDEETDLTKLNRDLTVAQYNTKEGGLKGGFTIDDATLEFMTNPEKMVTDTLDSLKQGYYDAKDTTNKIITAAGEIAGNLFKTEEGIQKGEDNKELALNPDVNKKTDDIIPKRLLLTVKVDGTEQVLESGSGNGLITEPVDQYSMKTGVDKYLCAFLSLLGMGKTLSDDQPLTVEEARMKYDEAVKEGYVGKNGFITAKGYSNIMGLNGADYGIEEKNLAIPIKGQEANINDRILDNLDEGLPVLVHLNSKTELQHKEYVTDYTHVNNELFYVITDSGGYKDVLIKADTMETYHKDDDGELTITKLKGGKIRKATNISFVTPKD